MHHGSVLVAVDADVNLNLTCCWIEENPYLDIVFDSNGAGIAPEIDP
jgi:hypothetical protein